MKLSDRSISALGKLINGAESCSPKYRTGPQLVNLFNEFGLEKQYGQGFPSRWKFTEECLYQLSNSRKMNELIKYILDPRDFQDAKLDIQVAIDFLNSKFKYDGYEIIIDGNFAKVHDLKVFSVEIENPFGNSDDESYLFIGEQIKKAENKIGNGDYDGAITNARALLEGVLIELEKLLSAEFQEYDGVLIKLYKRVQKLMNLDPVRPDIGSTLKQVLSGLSSIIAGLAGLRNKMSDAHVRTYKPSKHHALLVVNSSKTIVSFLVESFWFQKNKENE